MKNAIFSIVVLSFTLLISACGEEIKQKTSLHYPAAPLTKDTVKKINQHFDLFKQGIAKSKACPSDDADCVTLADAEILDAIFRKLGYSVSKTIQEMHIATMTSGKMANFLQFSGLWPSMITSLKGVKTKQQRELLIKHGYIDQELIDALMKKDYVAGN